MLHASAAICGILIGNVQRHAANMLHKHPPFSTAPPPPHRLAVLTLLIEFILRHLETRTAATCRAVAVARLPECGPDGTLLRVLDTGQITATRHAHCGRQIGRVCGKLVEDQSVAVAARLSRRQQRRQQQQPGEPHKGYFVAHTTAHTLPEIDGLHCKKNPLNTAQEVCFYWLAICIHYNNIYICVYIYTVKKYTAKKY